jgi:hypothetical protein
MIAFGLEAVTAEIAFDADTAEACAVGSDGGRLDAGVLRHGGLRCDPGCNHGRESERFDIHGTSFGMSIV